MGLNIISKYKTNKLKNNHKILHYEIEYENEFTYFDSNKQNGCLK